MKNELIKWDPFKEMNKEFGDFQRRLSSLFHRGNGVELPSWEMEEAMGDWTPAVDVSEDKDEYLIKADLPEVPKDKVKVSLAEGRLTIQGEREHEKEEKKKKYHRIERSHGKYVRSFRLPDEVDPEKIDAQFKDGVLTVRLPKSEEKKAKELEIAVH